MGKTLVFSLLATMLGLWIYPMVPMDDAYIYLRYAQNLAEDGVLSWNRDGTGVCCGMTGLTLFAMEAAIGPLIGYENSMFLICGVFLLLSVWMLHHIVSRLSGDRVVTFLVMAGFVFIQTNYAVTYDGLETTLGMFVSLLLVWLYLEERFTVIAWMAPLVFATRPEMVLLVVLLLIPRWRLLLLSAGLLGMYEVAYWAHFCHWLPLSFYVKSTGYSPWIFADIMCFSRSYLVLPVILLLLFCDIKRMDDRGERLLVVILGLFIFVVIAKYSQCRLLMGGDHRFLYTFIPLVYVLMSMVFVSKRWSFSVANILIMMFFVCVYGLNSRYEYVSINAIDSRGEFNEVIDCLESMGIDGKTFVCSDAGYIPFYTRMNHIDPFGLVNEDLAMMESTLDKRKYILEQSPDYWITHKRMYENDEFIGTGFGLSENGYRIVGNFHVMNYKDIVVLAK